MPDEPSYKYVPASIETLEIENFKSYKGHQVIGPFGDFTAVIGPNGSGKSNLMDAISFVLGVRTQQLRGTQLKELVYDSETEHPRRAYVKLTMKTVHGETVHFARHLNPSSSDPNSSYQSVYKMNDRTVTWEEYNAKLTSFGILVKVRNFLVFQVRHRSMGPHNMQCMMIAHNRVQGDIEAVAQKTPVEITQLIEQICGSAALKPQYDELLAAQQQAEEKVALLHAKRRNITQEKKQKKEQKDEAERYIKMQQELVRSRPPSRQLTQQCSCAAGIGSVLLLANAL